MHFVYETEAILFRMNICVVLLFWNIFRFIAKRKLRSENENSFECVCQPAHVCGAECVLMMEMGIMLKSDGENRERSTKRKCEKREIESKLEWPTNDVLLDVANA